MSRSLSATKFESLEYIFPTMVPKRDGEECRHDCANCTVKVDTTLPMYGHIKQFDAHVLVATGKAAWLGKVEEKGSLLEAFKSNEGKPQHRRIMVSASSLSPPESGDGEADSAKTTVFLLPSFTFVDGVAAGDVHHVIDTFIENPKQASRLSSRPCPHDYVVLLCSHQRRHARGGITAPLIKKELERHLCSYGLYRDLDDERAGGVGVYFVSHLGGHKFAANVLVYRKKERQRIWLERVRPEHCEGLVKYTILQGKDIRPGSQLRDGFDRIRGLTSW